MRQEGEIAEHAFGKDCLGEGWGGVKDNMQML
jgi:hypothetical protein